MPTVSRGQIVLVDFPYSDGRQSKIRPALVVQSNVRNANLSKTIIALITGNLRRQADVDHVLLDPAAHAGLGIHGPSLISCINLFTVEQPSILRILGQVPMELQAAVDTALRNALDL